MMEFAGLGITMENAQAEAEVKVAANYVTNTNDDDGIARALNEVLVL